MNLYDWFYEKLAKPKVKLAISKKQLFSLLNKSSFELPNEDLHNCFTFLLHKDLDLALSFYSRSNLSKTKAEEICIKEFAYNDLTECIVTDCFKVRDINKTFVLLKAFQKLFICPKGKERFNILKKQLHIYNQNSTETQSLEFDKKSRLFLLYLQDEVFPELFSHDNQLKKEGIELLNALFLSLHTLEVCKNEVENKLYLLDKKIQEAKRVQSYNATLRKLQTSLFFFLIKLFEDERIQEINSKKNALK